MKKIIYLLITLTFVAIGIYFVIDYENAGDDLVGTYYALDKNPGKYSNDKELRFLESSPADNGAVNVTANPVGNVDSLAQGESQGTFESSGDSGSLALKSNNGPGGLGAIYENPSGRANGNNGFSSIDDDFKNDGHLTGGGGSGTGGTGGSSSGGSGTGDSSDGGDNDSQLPNVNVTSGENTFAASASWVDENTWTPYQHQSSTYFDVESSGGSSLADVGCMWFACGAAVTHFKGEKYGVEKLLNDVTNGKAYLGNDNKIKLSDNSGFPCVGRDTNEKYANGVTCEVPSILSQYGINSTTIYSGAWTTQAVGIDKGYYIIYYKHKPKNDGAHWSFMYYDGNTCHMSNGANPEDTAAWGTYEYEHLYKLN